MKISADWPDRILHLQFERLNASHWYVLLENGLNIMNKAHVNPTPTATGYRVASIERHPKENNNFWTAGVLRCPPPVFTTLGNFPLLSTPLNSFFFARLSGVHRMLYRISPSAINKAKKVFPNNKMFFQLEKYICSFLVKDLERHPVSVHTRS